MHYTSFTIQHLIKGAAPKVIAALCHPYGGCGNCGDADCTCCAGGACAADCPCNSGKSCGTCKYTHRSEHFDYSVVTMKGGLVVAITTRDEVMQLDMYTEQQFDFYGLRTLVESLKAFSVSGHLTMTHVHRDLLPGEVPAAVRVDGPPPKPPKTPKPPKPHK